MSLVLNEEQSYLKDTARDFAKNKTPVSHFRDVRDSENIECFDREIWKEMASLGWSWNTNSGRIWRFRFWSCWNRGYF